MIARVSWRVSPVVSPSPRPMTSHRTSAVGCSGLRPRMLNNWSWDRGHRQNYMFKDIQCGLQYGVINNNSFCKLTKSFFMHVIDLYQPAPKLPVSNKHKYFLCFFYLYLFGEAGRGRANHGPCMCMPPPTERDRTICPKHLVNLPVKTDWTELMKLDLPAPTGPTSRTRASDKASEPGL